jgi:hypothetical protein
MKDKIEIAISEKDENSSGLVAVEFLENEKTILID